MTVQRAVLEDDLDVVGSFGEARVDERRAPVSRCVSVGIGNPYSVPWPPGAVASVPADNRSARSVFASDVRWRFASASRCQSVNMSSSVVTPKRGRPG